MPATFCLKPLLRLLLTTLRWLSLSGGLLLLALTSTGAESDGEANNSQNSQETAPGSNSSGKNKKKPASPKKPLSEAQLEQRRKAGKARARSFTSEYQSLAGKTRAKDFDREHQSLAGKALARTRGKKYMQELGTRGGEAIREKSPDFHEKGGETTRQKLLAAKGEVVTDGENGQTQLDQPEPEHGSTGGDAEPETRLARPPRKPKGTQPPTD